MGTKRVRSPQEKKRLSLDRDRRNDYGENSKASRKNLPKKRAKKNRALRRGSRTAIASGGDGEVMEKRLVRVARKRRRGFGAKEADTPLREHVARKKAWRARLVSEGSKRANKKG